MTKKISHSQAGLILCIFTISLKFSALPAIMFFFSGNDAYITCLIATLFDFFGTLIIASIIKKIPDKSFFVLVKETLGKVVAIIVEIMLFVYLFCKCIIILQELHDYFLNTLFEDLNPIYFFAILALFLGYTTTKDFRTIGRVMQLVFWPCLLCIMFTLIFPISDIQIERLLPIFEQGYYPIYLGLAKTNFAFGDYLILLILMGKIDVKENFKKNILIYISITLSLIVTFFVLFIGSFGDYAIGQTLALGELPLHSTTPSTIGKLEWLTVVIWTGILTLNSGVICVSIRECFDNIFSTHDKKLSTWIITILVISISILSYLQLDNILNIVTNSVFTIFSGAIHLSIILILILSYFVYIRNNQNAIKNTSNYPKTKGGKIRC